MPRLRELAEDRSIAFVTTVHTADQNACGIADKWVTAVLANLSGS